MGNNQSGSGSRLVAATLAFILVAFTFSTMYVFAARIWWPPETISPMGPVMDAQLVQTLIICGVVFFLAQLALAFVVLWYRDRGGRAHYSHGNHTMEIIWTIATAILFLALGIAAESAWAELRWRGAAPGAVQVARPRRCRPPPSCSCAAVPRAECAERPEAEQARSSEARGAPQAPSAPRARGRCNAARPPRSHRRA